MNTIPKRQRVRWLLMVALTLNGALGGYCAFGIANGSPPGQVVTAVQIINPRPGGSATLYVFFFGRGGYRHSSPTPILLDLEQGFWNWAPITAATFGGALAGALAAYLINRWLIQGKFPAAEPPEAMPCSYPG